VTPAPLTITADNKTKVYGAPLPALTASFTGFVNGDTASSLTTQPTLATTATIGSHVAGNPYPITASGAVDPDYTISYVASALIVIKADQTITFGPLADRILGEAAFAVSATASSGLPVAFAASGLCTVSGSTVTPTATGLCTITASQPGSGDFNAAPYVSQSFNVLSPAQFAQMMVTEISGMGLPEGPTTSLTSKLQAFAASAARGNTNAACGQLGAFVNYVNAQAGKQIPAANAALLLAEAARLSAVLPCH
jgi:hypothetical protein